MRILVISLVLSFGFASAGNAESLPDWRLADADGGSVRLSTAVQERPVVLLFWATWCPYCKALMPHLQSIRLEYGDAVDIFAIHIKDKKGDPVAFLESAGYDFLLLPHGDDVAELYEVFTTPGVIVVDRNMESRFDLRKLPQYDIPQVQGGKAPSHGKKAAYKAPYWAAALRAALDSVLADSKD
jgi:thiol-disulfide isomerase/thioredoxin